MSCTLTETTLVAGVDYEVDLVNGRILFKSTGLLGPDLATLLAGGGCGAQVDFCGTTPLHIPCASKIASCLPCNDDPVANISAEDSDTDRFLFNFNQRQRPRLGFRYENLGCKRWCFSEVSQEEADLCAILQALECINDGWRDETGPAIGTVPPFQVPQRPPLFFNFAQTCTTFCPDGTSFGFTLPAGQVTDRNQAQANRIAFSFACRISALRRVCIRTTSLPSACLDTFYQKQLLGSGGTPFRVTFDNFDTLSALCSPATSFPNSVFPYVWSATGLPNGLSVSPCSGMITGTPTQAGTFNVVLRAQDSLGSFQVKTLPLVVVEITTPTALPAFTVGTPYSETLVVNPTGTYSFQFVGGSPAGWISLNPATGELSGTPDVATSLSFSIEVESQDGTRCTKAFTLAVTIPAPFAYWKMEEGSGANREDSIGVLDLSPFGGGANPSVAGIIANAAELDAGGGASGLRRNNEVLFLHTGGGFTLCGWAMLPSYEGWAQLANFCELTYIISPANVFFDAFQIFAPADAFPGPGTHFKFGFYRNFGAQTIETGPDYAFNTWHFFRAWYDPADQKMHLQINNGAILDSAAFALTVGTNNASFGISSSLNIMRIDELGYWKEVLTDDVAAALYNSGNGLTWPF